MRLSPQQAAFHPSIHSYIYFNLLILHPLTIMTSSRSWSWKSDFLSQVDRPIGLATIHAKQTSTTSKDTSDISIHSNLFAPSHLSQ
jgi:hypothetical protein